MASPNPINVAARLLTAMEDDNGSPIGHWNNGANRVLLTDSVEAVLKEGWGPTKESIELLAAGEQLEAMESMHAYPSYEKMNAILNQIFNEGGAEY